MKSLFISLLFASAALAQIDVDQAAGTAKPFIEMLLAYLPAGVVGVLAVIGGFRMVFKPLMLAIEAITLATPNKKDDAIYKEVIEGNTYKTIRFIFDYIASIKLPVKKK